MVAQVIQDMDEISHRSIASGYSPFADEEEFCDISPLSKELCRPLSCEFGEAVAHRLSSLWKFTALQHGITFSL